MTQTITLPEFPVEGGCYCGAVRYRVLGRPLGVYRCHCKDCQRFSGGAWSMSMVLRRPTFEVIAGETVAFEKTADSGRAMHMMACPHCHTKLWNEPFASPDLIVLKPGTLDDSSWAVPAGNIWVGSKLPWVEIEPEFPAYPGQPATREPLYVAWDALVGND